MSINRRTFVWSAATGGLVLGSAAPRRSVAQVKRKLTYVGFAGKSSLLSQPYAEFARQVADRSGGELEIQWLGGTEVIAPFQATGAVAKGVFDIVLTGPAYYAAAVPEATAVQSGKASLSAMYKSGFVDALDRLHQQELNCVLLGMATGGVGFVFMAREPLATLASFKGKRFRSTPLLDPVLTALGAAPVTIGPSDVYAALERGVVDGLGWPEITLKEYGFYTRAKYLMRPSFYSVRNVQLMNKDTFEKYPASLQHVLRESTVATGAWAEKLYRETAAEELKAMKEAGLQEVMLDPVEAQQFVKLTEDQLWNKIAELSPKNAARLRELMAKAEAMT